MPSDESPCTYNPDTTPLNQRCWKWITDDEDSHIYSGLIDEKGDTNLVTYRHWHQDFYSTGHGDMGALITGTYTAPSIPNQDAVISGPRQVDIISLTNWGGTRRRVVSGTFTRRWEEFSYIGFEWPYSEVKNDGRKLEYTAELTLKNPFDGNTIDFSLEQWERVNGEWTGDCTGTGERTEGVTDFYQAAGIHNNVYMVTFYAEYLRSVRTDIPCAKGVNGYIRKCVDGQYPLGTVNWLNDCYYQRQTTILKEWPYKVKAFSKRVPEGGDAMDLNPFDLPDNNLLSDALKSVRTLAASSPYPEVNPENIPLNTRIFLQFFEEN